MISDALSKAILLRVVFYSLTAAGLFAALHWLAASIIYQGSASIPDPAAANAIGAQDVWLSASDGTKINAWWLHAEGSHLVTLFLHGNAGNIGHRADHIREILEAGSDVLIIDYRGYGRSRGHPSERGLSMDADAGYAYVAAQARERLAYVLPGETAYRVSDPQTVPDAPTAAPTAPTSVDGVLPTGSTEPWYTRIWASVLVAGQTGAAGTSGAAVTPGDNGTSPADGSSTPAGELPVP